MPQLRDVLDVEVLHQFAVSPDAQTGPVHQDAEFVPLAFTLHVYFQRRNQRKDGAHGIRHGLLILLVEDFHLHPFPGVSAVLRGMEIDAGIDPAFDEELAAKIKVLVFLGRAQPSGKSRALMHHDGAVADVECGFGTLPDIPASQRPAVKQRRKVI